MTMIYDMYRADIDYGKCEQLACMHVYYTYCLKLI